MKRIFAVLMCFMLMMAFAIVVNAEGRYVENDEVLEHQMNVSFTNNNHYTIEIPTSLAEHEEGEIVVTDAVVEMNYHIGVYITNLNENSYIDVENENGDKGEIDVKVDGSSVKFQKQSNYKACQFSSEGGTRSLAVEKVGNASGAGTYSGIVSFRCVIEPD